MRNKTINKFENVANDSLSDINMFAEGDGITLANSIVEILAYIRAFEELAGIHKKEMENIIIKRTGYDIEDLHEILRREQELRWI